MDTTASDHNSPESPRQIRSASPVPSWSKEQRSRLRQEWRRLQRGLAYHPALRLVSIQDEPPDAYDIEFRVQTLCVGESGELEYTHVVLVRLTLPLTFPNDPPHVRPYKAIFHPNISFEGLHLSASWQPAHTLLDFLTTVGNLLAFRAYDPDATVNVAAMEWMTANAESMPLDSTADFSPNADGTPLERIAVGGPATLAEVRRELEDVRHAMLDPEAAPGMTEMRDFCRHMSQTLSLFLPADIQEGLRREANVLETWIRELPASLPVWEFLREQRAAVHAIRTTNGDLSERHEPLLRQINILDALAPASEPTDVSQALAALPPQEASDILRLRFPPLAREVDDLSAMLRTAMETLDQISVATPVLGESELGRQLRAEVDASAGDSRTARASGAQMLATIDPILERSRGDTLAIEQICLWREYTDQMAATYALLTKVAHRGAAGIQAYYMDIEKEEFGPFQLEEPVDLGSARVSVRSLPGNRICVVDVATGDVIGKSDSGSFSLKLGRDSEGSQPTRIQLVDRCDELALQLEFLMGRTAQILGQIGEPATPSQSWAGKLLAILSRPETTAVIQKEHESLVDQCRLLLRDLQALEPTKARIETWNLLYRAKESATFFQRELAKQQAEVEKLTADLRPIISRCTRDGETGQLVVPAKLVDTYSEKVRRRDRASRTIARVEERLNELVIQVKRQLAEKRQVGTQGLPEFGHLDSFPPDLEEMVRGMTNAALAAEVAALESLLKTPLASEAIRQFDKSEAPPAAAATSVPQSTAMDVIKGKLPDAAVAAQDPLQTLIHVPEATRDEDPFFTESDLESDEEGSDRVEI